MPNNTTNYNLKKPLGDENYNVEDQNGNMDIIDTQLKSINDNKAAKSDPVFSGTPKIGVKTIATTDQIPAAVTVENSLVSDSITNAVSVHQVKLVNDLVSSKAPIASPTFTGNVVLPSTTTIGGVSSAELGYLDGVTSAIQTQLNSKAPLASPTFTGVVTAPTNTSYTTRQVRNTILSTADPSGGSNGDVWIKYTP